MRVFTGKVISIKIPKTATVVVERVVKHRLYKKRFKRVKKYHVHDEIGVREGDTVFFADSRPYSKTKRWKIIKIIKSKVKAKKRSKKR
jgi:small subunit ribosomal protein S17